VPTILSDLGLESPLVGMTVTAYIRSRGPDGFRCVVRDVATGRQREALLPRADAYDLPEGAAPPVLRAGDSVVALVVGVAGGGRDGTELLMLSATAAQLVERILAGFVDEILTGRVVITNVARVAGTKCKIAVAPTVRGVDARGACIGRSASRVKGAESLLNRAFGREKLEIIEYASDRVTFLRNAMNPVQAAEILVEGNHAVVAIEEHQLSGGIGEGGLNAELAGRLTDLYVRVVKAGTDLPEAMNRLFAAAPGLAVH
jgi:transcription antitermination factor NusA-like protein